MTRLMLIIIAFLLLISADITLAWDSMPEGQNWEKVRIYEKIHGDDYVLKAEVPGTETQATIKNVEPGIHIYVARSYNQQWGESADSNEARTDPGNVPPEAFRVLATVTVEVVVPN